VSVQLLGIVAVIGLAMGFNYTNGFHDAANAIATSVSTRALTPRAALVLAAVGNLVGSFFGAKVANTVGKGIIHLPEGSDSLVVVAAALIGAICWNLITWYFGLPSSSSHALIGGMVGAALAASAAVLWDGVVGKVVIPMVVSPVVGFILGYVVMLAIYWIFRKKHPGKLNRGFRLAQTCSAAAMAIGHGVQDAAKTMGIVVLALVVGGYEQPGGPIPLWVYFLTAAVLAAGTYAGGWRIIRTLGQRIYKMQPEHGFAAQLSAGTTLYAGTHFGFPISTTHVVTGSIMGAGATRRVSAVKWGVAGNILFAWLLTLPAAGLVAAALYFPVSWIF
jgi:PiT family inorganic phosphate transporter